jgi:molybdopterin converting factor small subunit
MNRSMEIEVVFTSQLRALLGASSIRIDLPEAATFAELLAELARRFSPQFREFALDEQGELRGPIMVCFGDQHVTPAATDRIPAGVVVTLMSPISGG